jgi:hypothetical protein
MNAGLECCRKVMNIFRAYRLFTIHAIVHQPADNVTRT